MTVGELKKKIAKLPDDLPIVTDSRDHSYRRIEWAGQVPAEKNSHGEYHEYYDREHLSADGKIVEVCRIN